MVQRTVSTTVHNNGKALCWICTVVMELRLRQFRIVCTDLEVRKAKMMEKEKITMGIKDWGHGMK